MRCYDCQFFTGEDYLACGIDPITAANSPELGCRDWAPIPNPWGFWEFLVNCPHVDDVQIGCVPVDGWQKLVCELFETLIYEDEDFKLYFDAQAKYLDLDHPSYFELYQGNYMPGQVIVLGNSIWRDRDGHVVGFSQAWKIEDKDWYENPDPLSSSGQMVLWYLDLLN